MTKLVTYTAAMVIYAIRIVDFCESGSVENHLISGPLYLTDLIESERIEEARQRSKVEFDEFENIKSFSGYFTVDKRYNSNLFFWFFPSEENYVNAPVLLWLQGGPGDSSMTGLFLENGPFRANENLTVEIREIRWTRKFSVVYIDNPVGTGYSFTDDGGYAQNQSIIGQHLHNALQQFYQLFPELQNNDLFITGESYAGKYIPAVAYSILKDDSKLKLNLKGLAIGSGYSDPINQYDYDEYLYQIGLIDSNVKRQMKELQKKVIMHIQNEQWIQALDIFSRLIYKVRNNTLFQNSSRYSEPINFLHGKGPSEGYKYFLQRVDVRNAIHVGTTAFSNGVTVAKYLQEDFSQSVAPWIAELLEHYKIMFYCGQVDLIVPYPVILNFLKKLNYSGADEYKTAPRHRWYVDGDLAGYYKQGGNLIEVLVRLAGHMIPMDQPQWALDIITSAKMTKLVAYAAAMVIYTVRIVDFYESGSVENHLISGPLYLTDLIESGRIEEARQRSKIEFDEFKSIKSFSGYFTVDKSYNSNLFFWFFPSEENYVNAPVLLWLQGGPGDSSMTGLFLENGPFRANKNLTVEIREIRWTRKFSVVYIDNPVGTGYSFTDEGGYAQNQSIIGQHLHNALQQFYQLFPELQNNDLFITGESYAGKYIPAVAYSILKDDLKLKLNLKGLAIGSGYSDPINQYDYDEYLYQIGLIDSNIKRQMKELQEKAINHIQNEEWIQALDIFGLLIYEARNNTLFQNSTGYSEPINFLHLNGPSINDYRAFLQRADVRNAIHVGTTALSNSVTVAKYLEEDFSQSVAPWIAELLEHYKIMFYCGQVDLIVPYPLILNFLKKLNYSGADDYKTAPRHRWYVDGDLAGYYKQGGNLIEVLVRLAGHMIPMDQPQWALDIITRFIHNTWS
ncbi:hypothetical protein FQA39_LY01024 [Lamprigera yunnana]|nr:hypothetical protein FQA39_LY01024 [Lamprigera yunnana]